MNNDLISAARAALNYIEEPPAKLWPAGTLHRITINLRTALAAAEAQPVGEPFGYVITNNVPEDNLYRHVFYRPDQISTAYKDNALYSTPVYASPAAPAQAPTDEFVYRVVRSVQPHLDDTCKAWGQEFAQCKYWLDAAHGIGSKA